MNVSKIFTRLSLRKNSAAKKPTGRALIAHWDRERVYYLIASAKNPKVHSQDAGIIWYDGQATSPLMALADHLRVQEISIRQLVILLSRPELEQFTLNLPPAEPDELPALVAGAVEQHMGDADRSPIADYYTLNWSDSAISSGTSVEAENAEVEVLAFAISANLLDAMRQDVQQAGFQLTGIGSRQLSALHLLDRVSGLEGHLNIVLHLYPGEIELALCEGKKPQLLRSVRISFDEVDRTIELLRREVQRGIALLSSDVEDLPQQWILFDTGDAAKVMQAGLEQSTGTQVLLVDPMHSRSYDGPLLNFGQPALRPTEHPEEKPDELADPNLVPRSTAPGSTLPGVFDGEQAETDSTEQLVNNTDSMVAQWTDWMTRPTAALSGAAWELWQDGLRINLIQPKRPPPAPNPLYRTLAWASAGVLVAAITGYALMRDVWSLQQQVVEMQDQVQSSGKLANKLQEKTDQSKYVENWLSDQIDWLEVLGQLSARLPDGQDASVSRLTASSNGAQGTIDISVQVVQPEKITELENRLRGVKFSVNSKRISQTAEQSEYPWRFETRIGFDIEPQDWRSYAPASVSSRVVAAQSEPESLEAQSEISASSTTGIAKSPKVEQGPGQGEQDQSEQDQVDPPESAVRSLEQPSSESEQPAEASS